MLIILKKMNNGNQLQRLTVVVDKPTVLMLSWSSVSNAPSYLSRLPWNAMGTSKNPSLSLDKHGVKPEGRNHCESLV